MSLFKSIIFSNVVQIVSSDDNRSLHLHLDHGSSKNATPDRNVSSEWTLLVDVFAFEGLTGCFET